MTILVNTETSFSQSLAASFVTEASQTEEEKTRRQCVKRIKFPVLLYLVSDVLYLKENPFKLKKGGFIFQCE
jgi:hypothetical protein